MKTPLFLHKKTKRKNENSREVVDLEKYILENGHNYFCSPDNVIVIADLINDQCDFLMSLAIGEDASYEEVYCFTRERMLWAINNVILSMNHNYYCQPIQ